MSTSYPSLGVGVIIPYLPSCFNSALPFSVSTFPKSYSIEYLTNIMSCEPLFGSPSISVEPEFPNNMIIPSSVSI